MQEVQKVASERQFGTVFAIFFAILGGIDLFGVRSIWVVLALIFALITITKPSILKPLNILWFKLGLLLHKVANPIILGFIFFVVITPIALLLKLFGKDLLRLKYDSKAKTYWMQKDNKTGSMRQQF